MVTYIIEPWWLWGSLLLLQAADAKYGEGATKVVGPDQEVVFEEEQITLDIKADGEVLENGWRISPDTYPRVSISNKYVNTLKLHSF